jgi:hypothetical protein
MVRGQIERLQRRQPDFDELTPEFAEIARPRAEHIETLVSSLGALQSVTFKGVGPGGFDKYDDKFESGAIDWRILIDGNGSSLPGSGHAPSASNGRKGQFVDHPNPIGRQRSAVASADAETRACHWTRGLTCMKRDAKFMPCSGSRRPNYNNNAASKAVLVCVHSGTET